jgi:signal transduction histidine kinase
MMQEHNWFANQSNGESHRLKTTSIALGLALALLLGLLTLYSSISPLTFAGELIDEASYISAQNRLHQHEYKTVTLPHVTEKNETGRKHTFYLIKFNSPVYAEPVLVLHSIKDSGYVYLNGVQLAEVGRMEIPEDSVHPRNRHIPTLINLPEALLEDTNLLEIELKSAWPVSLGRITLAEADDVRLKVVVMRFLRVNFIWFGIAFALPMAFFLLSVWYFHRQRVQYFWLGLVMCIWPWNTLYMILPNSPMPDVIYGLVPVGSNIFYATALCCFVLAYRGVGAQWVKPFWCVSTGLFSVILITYFLGPNLVERPAVIGGYLWMAILAAIATWNIGRYAFEARSIRSLLMAVSGTYVEVIAVYDFIPFLGITSFEALSFPIQYGIILVLLCYSAVMSFELAVSLQLSDHYNTHLSEELRIQNRKLKRQYEDIVRLEKQQSIHAERTRLIADMHDGTSGHISSILAGLKSENLAPNQTIEQLEACLRDLRLILDSMNFSATEDLASALGLLRSRMSPLIESVGVNLVWSTFKIDDGISYPPNTLLAMFRIMQEALVNAMQHSSATEIKVSATQKNDLMVIQIEDNGTGFDTQKASLSGYGLNSMRSRANLIEAELSVVSSGAGTRIKMQLPSVS